MNAADKLAFFDALADAARPDQCQLWPHALTGAGYGVLQFEGRTRRAHAVAWELARGPMPVGFTIDHWLRNTADPGCVARNVWNIRCALACVNLFHLEPVANRTNILRGRSPSAVNARRVRCSRGHTFNEGNTMRRADDGSRECRRCARVRRHPLGAALFNFRPLIAAWC